MENIFGAKSGGDSRTPVEAPDNVRSKQIARFIDILCEGEIAGLVDGLKSVYLNETPVVSDDNSFNFKDVSLVLRTGTLYQDPVPDMTDTEFETAVGTEVKFGTPVTRTLSNVNVGSVRVTVGFPQMTEQNLDNGDLNGSSVKLRIQVQSGGAGFNTVVTDTVTCKTTSRYQRQYLIDLSGEGPWDIRVVRDTPDSTSSAINNKSVFDSFTGIIPVNLAYPHTAFTAIRLDSANFSSVPSRAYHIRGSIVRVPSNYSPATRAYTGIWDGTFKLAWTDNPAWGYLELITNKRFGLGQWITDDMVDKWELYSIARYCDQLVPDGKGGMEPRFTCNLYLQTSEDAYKVIQNLASVFRAITYWAAGATVVTQDRPGDPIAQFTGSNVIDGAFNYTGTSLKSRHTVALVTWNDPEDFYRPKVQYVQDPDMVKRYGIIDTPVVAFGCTSAGQAYRFGKWLLNTERYADESITFTTGMEGLVIYPGAIFSTSDPNRAGVRLGGRMLAIDAARQRFSVDGIVDLTPGHSYLLTVTMADGKLEKVAVAGAVARADATGSDILLAVPLSAVPVTGAIWVMADLNTVEPEQWRVTSLVPSGTKVDVTGLRYVDSLYDSVEHDIEIIPQPISVINTKPAKPDQLACAVSQYRVEGRFAGLRALLSWSSNAGRFRVSWRRVGTSWQSQECVESAFEINNVDGAVYDFMVVAIGPTGRESAAALLSADLTVGAAAAIESLAAPANVRLISPYTRSDAIFGWDAVPEATGYEVQISRTADPFVPVRAQDIGNSLRFTYAPQDMAEDGGPFRSLTLRVRAYTLYGKTGDWGSKTASNPQIAELNGIEVTAGVHTIYFDCKRPTDSDFAGIAIWLGATADFTPGDSNLVYRGNSTFNVITSEADGSPLEDKATYYVRAAGYDTIGWDSLNISGSIAATVLGLVPDKNSIIADMIAEGALTITKFADGIEPVGIVDALPAVLNYAGPTTVLWGDVLYRLAPNATKWEPVVPADGSLGPEHLGANSVTAGKIAAGAVNARELAAGAITTDVITIGTEGGIPGTFIKNGTIKTQALESGAISTDKLAVNSVNALKIAAEAIQSRHIGAQQVTADKINGKGLQLLADDGTYIVGGNSALNPSFLPDEGKNSLLVPAIAAAATSTFTAGDELNFDFKADKEGWYGANNTPVTWVSGGWIRVDSANTDPMFSHDFSGFAGAQYDKVRMRVRRTAGSTGSGWDGTLFSNSEGVDAYVTLPNANLGKDWKIIEWDMSSQPVWLAQTITHIRIDLGTTPQDSFDIDWIAIGKYAAAPSVASVQAAATTATGAGFSGTVGGDNLTPNSSFERYSGTMADGFAIYNNAGASEPTSSSIEAGRNGGKSVAISWSPSHTNTKGILGQMCKPGWVPGKTYMLAVWAKTSYAPTSAVGLFLAWNTGPLVAEGVKNPPLSTEWQRYVFRIIWGDAVEANGFAFISLATGSGNGNVWFDDLMVVEGDVMPAYYPSTSEAQAAAEAAQALIKNITDDGILDRSEKSQLRTEWASEDAVWAQLRAQANNLGVDYSNYDANHNATSQYLISLSPPWNDTTQDTAIDREYFRNRWKWLYEARQALQNAVSAKASTMATYGNVSGKPDVIRVYTHGNTASNRPAGLVAGLYMNGNTVRGYNRSYNLVIFRRSDMVMMENTDFDVFGAGEAGSHKTAADLAYYLNVYADNPGQYIIILYTADEPSNRRDTSGLPAAIYRNGGSRAIFMSPDFQSWSAYALVAISGCGEGNGAEFYQGSIYQDPNAWIDFSLSILKGDIVSISPAYTPRTLRDYNYFGDPDATKGAPAGTIVGSSPAQSVDMWAQQGATALAAIPGINLSIADRLSQSAGGVMDGPVALRSNGAFYSGDAQYRSPGFSGSGTVMSPYGFAAIKAGIAQFAADVNGNVFLAGEVRGAYGTFGSIRLPDGSGRICSGDFTGWAWPDSRAVGRAVRGFYLGPEGYITGDYYAGKWFQITSDGNVYGPGFRLENGRMTIENPIIVNPDLRIPALTVTVTQPGGNYRTASKNAKGVATQSAYVSVSGGSGNYKIQWTVEGPSCYASNPSADNCAVIADGRGLVEDADYTLICNVTDLNTSKPGSGSANFTIGFS